jgi:4-amino-4-deoxy-L-arabinose transferase-like glycosyltransferase
MVKSFNEGSWERLIRFLFWTIGPFIALVLTYTTRFFINGDAIAYVEIGAALRDGNLWELANLTYSPGYPALLSLGQILFNTNPLNELELLRIVNFFCFLLAMGSCELFTRILKRETAAVSSQDQSALHWPMVLLLSYSLFLVAALVWVKVRLLNPDMLVMAVMLTCTAVVLWIRENPEPHKYAVLGICCGIGYLVKSFFFVFSGVFFLLAALCAGSYWKAVSRVAVAVALMLLVGSPLILALSHKLGRFTTGELGKTAYAVFIAGQGTQFRPKLIDQDTRTRVYRHGNMGTRPSGYDICYWSEGVVPKFDFRAHARVFSENLLEVFRQLPFIFVALAWYLAQIGFSGYSFRSSHPPSFFFLVFTVCLAGVGFYSLIHVETRYLAGPLFIGFSGLVASVRRSEDSWKWKTWIPSLLFLLVLWAHLLYSGVDQSLRSYQSTPGKPSYKQAFLELHAVKDFLRDSGVTQGAEVGILGNPPTYWARFAGIHVTAEIEEPERFLATSGDHRLRVLQELEKEGIRAVVGKDNRLKGLEPEGWRIAQGTRDYYLIFLNSVERGTRP